jgi:hypothetical protein
MVIDKMSSRKNDLWIQYHFTGNSNAYFLQVKLELRKVETANTLWITISLSRRN